jgi:16S rRNA (uracil1498-N3)-methyltransferase
MECIYYPELNRTSKEVTISGKQAYHLKALRLNVGDSLFLTNGKGVLAEVLIIKIQKDNYTIDVKNINENYGELSVALGLAIPILDNRERFEFALEKAIELGISDFYPIITKYTQKKIINIERLKQKAIAAIEQCKRSVLPNIHEPIRLQELLKLNSPYEQFIISDMDGEYLQDNVPSTPLRMSLIFVGPEGGFSDDELELFHSDARCSFIKLSSRRLRAETAAITVLGIISSKIESKFQ